MVDSIQAPHRWRRLAFDLSLGAFLFGLLLIVWLPSGSAAKLSAPSAAPVSVLPTPGTPVFNICLQDDSNPSTVLLFSSQTGDYRFCCGGTAFTGKGTVIARGSVISLQQSTTDRRVQATVDLSTSKGSAAFQSPPGTTRCTITDRNITNNTCNCP